MVLSFQQLKQVAELVYNPGYILLMDSLQAHLDDISHALLAAEPAQEPKLLARWRAASEYLALLKNNPENIALELKTQQELQESILGPQLPERFVTQNTSSLSPEQIRILREAYERKTKTEP